MRVLHFFKTYYPDSFGGVERTIHALAKGGLAHGIQSDVLSLSREPAATNCEFDGHTAHKAKLDFELASTGFSYEALTKFADLSTRADIVHYHFPWPFMDLVHLLKPHSKPTVVTYHSDIIKQKGLLQFYKPMMNRFLSSVDRIVATSDNYAASSETLQRHNERVSVIPLGLDETDYPRAPPALKQMWQDRFKRPFFLFVGVLRYYKGLHLLMEAARQVDADLLIVGKGPMEEELKAQAQQLNLSNVYFLGALSDLDKAALLETCHAFVFPSHLRSEAYGLSLVEAAMFGKPMISCEIGTGTSFVNINRHTGIVVPPDDPTALSGAMSSLLNNSGTAKLYGSEARTRYLEQLQASLMVERYVELYEDTAKLKFAKRNCR